MRQPFLNRSLLSYAALFKLMEKPITATTIPGIFTLPKDYAAGSLTAFTSFRGVTPAYSFLRWINSIAIDRPPYIVMERFCLIVLYDDEADVPRGPACLQGRIVIEALDPQNAIFQSKGSAPAVPEDGVSGHRKGDRPAVDCSVGCDGDIIELCPAASFPASTEERTAATSPPSAPTASTP